MWQVFRCYRRVAAGQAVHQTTGSIRGETRVQALLAQRRSRQGRVTRRGSGAAGMHTGSALWAASKRRRGDGASGAAARGTLVGKLSPAGLCDEHRDELPDRAVIDAAALAVHRPRDVIDGRPRNGPAGQAVSRRIAPSSAGA